MTTLETTDAERRAKELEGLFKELTQDELTVGEFFTLLTRDELMIMLHSDPRYADVDLSNLTADELRLKALEALATAGMES
jgi:hypothetical protein